MDIIINQSIDRQENVVNTLLTKLATLVATDANINLTGNIYVSSASMNTIYTLCQNLSLIEDQNNPGTYRGDNFILVVGATYISFEDQVVESLLIAYMRDSLNMNVSDGITTTNAGQVSSLSSTMFRGNTSIQYFGELYKFTNLTTLPGQTFLNCTNLEKINISSITNIGNECFKGCTSLTSVNINTGASVGNSAFSGCTNLWRLNNSEPAIQDLTEETIEVDGNFGNYAFSGCSNLFKNKTLRFPSSFILQEGVFKGTGVKKVNSPNWDLPSSGSIFTSCTNLQEVTVNNINNIGSNAFQGCSSLTVINASNIVESQNQSNETVLELPIYSVGSQAFWGDTLLFSNKNIKFTGNSLSLEFRSFSGTKLKSITYLQNSVTLGNECFLSCNALTTVNIPYITQIPQACFQGCTALNNYEIPNGVTTIGKSAFRNTSNNPFKWGSHIVIPANVTEIGNFAFNFKVGTPNSGSSHKFIFLGSTPPTLGPFGSDNNVSVFAYDGTSPAKIYVPSGCAKKYKKSFTGIYVTSINENDDYDPNNQSTHLDYNSTIMDKLKGYASVIVGYEDFSDPQSPEYDLTAKNLFDSSGASNGVNNT